VKRFDYILQKYGCMAAEFSTKVPVKIRKKTKWWKKEWLNEGMDE
jgi:hypothetical protein